MPWWAEAYLVLFGIVSLYGIYDDCISKNPLLAIAGNVLSLVFVFIFVFAFYDDQIYHPLKSFIPLMIGIGILSEIYSAKVDIEKEFPDPELDAKENKILFYFAICVVFVLIVPGYAFGIALLLR